MKNYNHSYSFLTFTILFFVSIIVNYIFLNHIKIYDYLTLMGVPIEDNKLMIMVEKKNNQTIEVGRYFYSKDKKIFYKINSKQKEKSYNIYVLSLSDKIEKKKKIDFSIPIKKKSLFTILYENWRLK